MGRRGLAFSSAPRPGTASGHIRWLTAGKKFAPRMPCAARVLEFPIRMRFLDLGVILFYLAGIPTYVVVAELS